jgi:hypothetical protein
MTTLDSLTKTFDNLFITTMQNILGTNIEICKWSFLFTSVGVGINVILNSFYFVKVSNENNILKSKINLLLNETKVINESNITIYEMLQKNTFKIDSLIKNTNYEKKYLLDDVVEDYCMPNCDF